jgi:hypothetical protein
MGAPTGSFEVWSETRPRETSSRDTSAGFNSPPGQGPPLVLDANGNAWLVTEITPRLAQSILWQMLLDPHTFGSDRSPSR